MTLSDLIRDGKIEFFSKHKILGICDDFGKYGELLTRHLAKQSGDELIVQGVGLESALIQRGNLTALAEVIVEIAFNRKRSTYTHVVVDVTSMENYYKRRSEDVAVNLAGTVRVNMAGWLPQLSEFDRQWNVAMCSAMSGAVGTGFEWPQSENEFKNHVACNAREFVVGLPGQIKRYLDYVDFVSDMYTRGEIRKIVRKFSSEIS